MVELCEGLKIPWPVMAVRVQVPLRVQILLVRGRLKMKYNLRWPFLCLQKKSGKPKLRSVRTCPSP